MSTLIPKGHREVEAELSAASPKNVQCETVLSSQRLRRLVVICLSHCLYFTCVARPRGESPSSPPWPREGIEVQPQNSGRTRAYQSRIPRL